MICSVSYGQSKLSYAISGSERGPACEAEEQGLADVAGGTRNGDADSLI